MSPRSRAERRRDTLRRLVDDIDCWVASTGSASAEPYLTPLSFSWDGSTLLLSTSVRTRTAANLRATGRVRLGLGSTRDVVMIEGEVSRLDPAEIDVVAGDAFAVKVGFDPRTLATPYDLFRVRPVRIQAWREEDELADRDLMRDGVWLD